MVGRQRSSIEGLIDSLEKVAQSVPVGTDLCFGC